MPREAAAAKADLESLSPEMPCCGAGDAGRCLLSEMENSSYHKSAPSDVSLPQQRWPGQHRAIAIALRHYCEDSVAGLVKRCSRAGGVRREDRGSTQKRRLRLCALR